MSELPVCQKTARYFLDCLFQVIALHIGITLEEGISESLCFALLLLLLLEFGDFLGEYCIEGVTAYCCLLFSFLLI